MRPGNGRPERAVRLLTTGTQAMDSTLSDERAVRLVEVAGVQFSARQGKTSGGTAAPIDRTRETMNLKQFAHGTSEAAREA